MEEVIKMRNGYNYQNPVVVVALDAADYDLAQHWECDNLLLENHAPLETFSYTYDHPYTPEVWASIATGQHPSKHGVHGNNDEEWDIPFLNWLSDVASFLPNKYRSQIGGLLEQQVSSRSISVTDHDHVFTSGFVYEWPGITDSPHLIEAWDLIEKAKNNEISEEKLFSDLIGDLGKKVGWLQAMSMTATPIVGTHIHYLDIAGHVFARRENQLKERYQKANQLIGDLERSIDRLIVLSDHGMQTSFLNDNSPGEHSERALIATNFETTLPECVFNVAGWLTPMLTTEEASHEVQIDTPVDHLKDLGYIS